MTVTALSAEGVSKRYRIGTEEDRPDTLTGAVLSALRRPAKNLRRLRRLARFDDADEDVVWALRDVSFEVRHGEVVGLIGRNGAGKSTMLKILSRITSPTEGRVVLHGRVASLLEVGTGFHPELTGRENIYLNGTILGMTRAEITRQFDEIVEFSGVERFLDTPVKRYSSGMRVRLAFSVAAHLEAEILLIDEVLSVGDAAFQKRCLGKMGDVAKAGRTVVLVSHNMSSILRFCPNSYWLDDGRVKASGASDVVVQRYLSETLESDEDALQRDLDLEMGGVRIEHVALRSDRPSIPMGRGFDLVLGVDGELNSDRIHIALVVEDASTSERIFTAATDSQKVHPLQGLERGPVSLTCRVPDPRLLAGSYTVTVALTVRGRTGYAERALAFEILPADVTGSGNVPGRNRGVVYSPASWTTEAHPR